MSKSAPSSKSYSLLLKGVKEIEKSKQPKKLSPKKKTGVSNNSTNSTNKSSDDNGAASQQEKSANGKKVEEVYDPDIPDRSYGDYYCKLCDSHMNAVDMWEAHVTGKRHIKNVEKGDSDSKYEDLPNVESSIKAEMKNVKEPVVGLSYIHEIRRKEPNIPPIYNCFLCHASIATVPLVTEHVLSLKHRLHYIKENNPEQYSLINATNLKKGLMEPLVTEVVIKMEEEFGRGTVKVKQEKQKKPVTTYSAKKTFNLDKKATYSAKKNLAEDKLSSRFDSNPSVWKSYDTQKRQEEKNFDDRYMNRSRSRSPISLNERKQTYSEEKYSMEYSGNRRRKTDRDPSPIQIVYERHESFSKRDDYNHDYLQRPRNNDLPDDLNNSTSRHHTRHPVKLNSPDQQPGNNFFPQDLSSPGTSMFSQMSVMDIVKIISILPMGERFHLLGPVVNQFPKVSSQDETIYLLNHLCTLRKMVKENDFYDPLVNFLSQAQESESEINIPGLGEGFASSAKQQLRNIAATNSAEACFTSNNSNYSSASNIPAQQKPFFPSQQSYAPSSSSQQAGNVSAYHSFQTVQNSPRNQLYSTQNSASQGRFLNFPQSSSHSSSYSSHKY